jgi:hypothetical protein
MEPKWSGRLSGLRRQQRELGDSTICGGLNRVDGQEDGVGVESGSRSSAGVLVSSAVSVKCRTE